MNQGMRSIDATRPRVRDARYTKAPGPTNFNLRRLELVVILVALILVTGCAVSDLPNKTFVRHGPDYVDVMPRVDRVGLLIDGTVVYDGIGSRYFDVEDSRTAIENLSQATQADLTAKGYDVAFVEAPFVGGFMKPGQNYPVALARNADPQQKPAPFETASYLNSDAVYRDNLLTTTRQVALAAGNSGRFPTDTLQSSADAKAALTGLAARKNVRYVLIVQGIGVIESPAKQVGQVVGTAILIGVLSLGTLTGSSHNVSYLDTYVSLLDLSTAEVVWSNALRLADFNPAEARDYASVSWARKLLYWLPPRGHLEPLPPTKQ